MAPEISSNKDKLLPLITTPAYATGKNDPFTIYASRITLSHNAFIRGFNSIYQQAPNLTPSDHKDFIGYCLAWYTCVGEDHSREEIRFFSAMEDATGEEGILDHEVTFYTDYRDDMQKLKNYLLSFEHFRHPETEFDVSRLLFLMDRIAHPLHTHLASVPQSILALSRFSTPERPIDLLKIDRSLDVPDEKKTTNYIFNVLPAWLLNLETEEFEGGRWKGWPESKVKRVLTGLVPLMNRGRWRFSSCDWRGRWRKGRS
ncbi:hypothetical protein HO173_006330 [Letharia columbiana]|uniref:Uncharacterized protein n=1 Tax=Letharia columbiana TaxID=112416 RepID=A0A8H6FVN0_9LECA|nr:uncharacterized protein HO173_006330 [Letharia columbiana]KAF6235647.1 hypothetical protein HO173_006330 [Letharia columbiana]